MALPFTNAFDLSGPKPAAAPVPSWPKWQEQADSIVANASLSQKVPSARTLNRVQQSQEQTLLTVAGDTRKLGPIYGPATIGGRVDIFRQIGSYIYIRALLCVGEISQISAVQINDANYLTGDPTGDPDYQGDWEDSAVWTGGHALPYSASAGEIYLYGGAYYEVNQAFTVTAYTGSYNPAGAYASYFDQLVTNASVNTYKGTTGQGVDPLLSGAGGWLAGYAETLTGSWYGTAYGIAYVAIRLLATEYTGGFPRITASLNGALLYDPRSAATAYSTNPALALADFITSPLYGLGRSVDWSSVGTAADYCDTAFADGARIRIGLAIAPETPDRTADWVDVLRGYALCWLDVRAGVYFFLVDGPRTADGAIAFDQGTGTDPELASLPALTSVPIDQRPNRVRVYYTSGQATTSIVRETAGVTAETEEPRDLELRMPGLFSAEMAGRYADYRLALAETERYRVSFGLYDAGIRVEPGQVWTLTAPNGFTGQKLRIIRRESQNLGDYAVVAQQYDESVYASP